MNKLAIALSILIPAGAGTGAWADQAHHAQAGSGAASGAATATGTSALASGEVTKVDKEASKITIKHGPIPNLDMPGMTMVFRVKDPAMLNDVKAGDQIRFSAEKVGGNLTVTKVESAK